MVTALESPSIPVAHKKAPIKLGYQPDDLIYVLDHWTREFNSLGPRERSSIFKHFVVSDIQNSVYEIGLS